MNNIQKRLYVEIFVKTHYRECGKDHPETEVSMYIADIYGLCKEMDGQDFKECVNKWFNYL